VTEPGTVIPPKPGWWVRTTRTGAASGTYEWVGTPLGGETPLGHSSGTYSWTGAARGPVVFDAIGAGKTTGVVSSWSWLQTLAANASAILVQGSGYTSASSSMTMTATIGSTPIPLLASNADYAFDGSGYLSAYLFGLLNPPTGLQTIALASSVANDGGGNSVSYIGVESIGSVVANTGTTGAPTVTVPSAPGQIVVGAFGDYLTTFSGLNGTSRWNVPHNVAGASNMSFMLQDAPGAASVTLSAAAGVTAWAAFGVPLIP
jgi:hypothetical protein